MATKRKTTKTEGPVKKVTKPAAKKIGGESAPIVVKRKSATTAKPKGKEKAEISSGLIALRAYYIGEKRAASGQPGDSLTDWLEAERQLTEEQNS